MGSFLFILELLTKLVHKPKIRAKIFKTNSQIEIFAIDKRKVVFFLMHIFILVLQAP